MSGIVIGWSVGGGGISGRMLKTANQRLAALVLIGGAVLIAYLLWFALAYRDELIGAWLIANYHVLMRLSDHELFKIWPEFAEGTVLTSITAVVFFILSCFSGWLLALRLLLKEWRKTRRARGAFTTWGVAALLVLMCGAITVGSSLWHMDDYDTSFALIWRMFNAIIHKQLSHQVYLSANYPEQLVQSTNLTMLAFASSYVLSLLLAGGTLWRRVRALARLARQRNRKLDIAEGLRAGE